MGTIELYEDNAGGLWLVRYGVPGTRAARVGGDVHGGPFADDAAAMAQGWDDAWDTDFEPREVIVGGESQLVAEYDSESGEITHYETKWGSAAREYLTRNA